MLSFLSSLSFLLFLFSIPCLIMTSHVRFPVFLPKLLGLNKTKVTGDDDDTKKRDDEGTHVVREKELQRELVPRHVAIIMDGNRRWAEKAGLLTSQGPETAINWLTKIAELLFEFGIHTVSGFAFSTENWGRDKGEVEFLMCLFQRYFKSNIQYFQRKEIRISIIGNKTKIPESLVQAINEIEEATKGYKDKHIIMAIDYSGNFDIVQACKSIVKKSEKGFIREEDVDERLIERELLTSCIDFPKPDLMIRTSGEQRISNFLVATCLYRAFLHAGHLA